MKASKSLQLLFLTPAIALADVSDIAGDYWVANFAVPSFVTYDQSFIRFNNGDNFDFGLGDFSITTGGVVSGDFQSIDDDPETLTGLVTEQGENFFNFRIDETGEEMEDLYFTGFANSTSTLFAANWVNEENAEIIFSLKKPTTATWAQMNGDWTIILFATPSEIVATDVGGGNIMTTGTQNFEVNLNEVTFSGTNAVDNLGTGTVTPDGQVNLDLTMISENFDAATNSSLDLLVGISRFEESANEFLNELLFGIRKPQSLSLGDVAGTWRGVGIFTPAQTGFEEMPFNINLFLGGDEFGRSLGSLTVATNGDVSGIFDGAFTGSLSVENTNELLFTGDPEPGESAISPVPLFINNSLDIMVAVNNSPPPEGYFNNGFDRDDVENFFEIIVFMKVDSTQDFRDLIRNALGAQFSSDGVITWSPSEGRVVERSTDLLNWSSINETFGDTTYDTQSDSLLGGSSEPVFFRVNEKID